ncbi:Glucosyltransferase-like protein [Rhizophlyctis rosea]|uniref:Alpha-1,3-glucosyltransferase n=1 Tax=Rhizophlyctis rosea TaxID=64517 RepID=A0AAD5SKE0_9FUNG|nr:Glucosyltransferase-like protein [Rhizophlyctis rosea]
MPKAKASTAPEASSNAYKWFHTLQETNGQHLALILTYLFAALVKWCIGLNGYSGAGVPPKFGDFEAQRHWLEITAHLPVREWYRYDLKWWGLDYPPLTAYHSWFMGKLAHLINPKWVALDTSRGLEEQGLKVFMRATALLTEYLIYVPPLVLFVNRWVGRDWVRKNVLILLILLQPALNIIDHGHFQFNSAMLGFALWSFLLFCGGNDVAGAVFFCFSLLYKQMALFYAIPVFCFLLGRCLKDRNGFALLLKLGAAVVVTFAISLLPFLGSLDDVVQIFRRVFPVERGLYEDKVANVWCAVNVVVKLRQLFDMQKLMFLSIAATLAAVLPSSIDVLLRPDKRRLIYAVLNGSLGFFLFSFQVHEKSILLPLLPATLLLLDEPLWSVWFNNVAMFSMFPLLKRDELVLPYFITIALWNWLGFTKLRQTSIMLKALIAFSYALIATIQILEFTTQPPANLPDIYTVANVELSTALFCLFALYFNYRQFTLPSSPRAPSEKTKTQ